MPEACGQNDDPPPTGAVFFRTESASGDEGCAEQIEVLKEHRVDPSAFIWVHAQNESNPQQYVKAIGEGAWVSLDGLRRDNVEAYVEKLAQLKREKCLHSVLVSHDAGWYDPGKENGGEFREMTVLFRQLIPALEQAGFIESEIIQLIETNPARAFAISVKKWKKNKATYRKRLQ